MTSLTDLPIDILLLVLRHVPSTDYYQCALINSLFHTVVTPLLWRTIKITVNSPNSEKCIETLTKTRPTVVNYIKHMEWLDYEPDMTQILKYLPRLSTLTIKQYNGMRLWPLVHSCPHLTLLVLCNIPLTQFTVNIFIQHCRHLRILEIESCSCRSPCFISGRAPGSSLEKLKIQFDGEYHFDYAYEEMETKNTVLDLTYLSRLTHLEVHGGGPIGRYSRSSLFSRHSLSGSMDDDALMDLVHCPLLVSLKLYSCFELDESDVIAVIRSHPHLKYLTLDGYGDLCSDDTLYAVATYLPGIMELCLLALPRFSPEAIVHLANACMDLRLIDVLGFGIDIHRFALELEGIRSDPYRHLETISPRGMEQIRNDYEDGWFDVAYRNRKEPMW